MPAIQTRALIKNYRAVKALKGVDIAVEKGEIYGLLGPNGAGKSTLIKILLGIVRRTEGDAQLLDLPAGHAKVRERVGYLPEDHRFPEYHTAETALDFYGALCGVSRAVRRQRIPELLEMVGLPGEAGRRKIRTYSKGMKQRFGMAQAMIHSPEVIFLDEPTDGVDPLGRREIRDVLLDLKKKGVTIFLNSHLLSEVERVCDRVGMLAAGELKREGTVAQLTGGSAAWRIQLDPGPDLAAMAQLVGGRVVEHAVEVEAPDAKALNGHIDRLRAAGALITGVAPMRRTLEDVYLEQYADDAAPGGAA